MSEVTYLVRWQRYQIARLEGLIDGLRVEAERLHRRDFSPVIDLLGQAMLNDLKAQCEELKARAKDGDKVPMPELRFERL